MTFTSVCRVCLSSNRRMKLIANTELQTLFEKLTNNQLITSDGRPESVCYLCHLLLNKCCKFVDMSQRAEVFFTQFLCSHIEESQKNLIINHTAIEHDTSHAFMVTNISYATIVPKDEVEDSKGTLKIEPEDRNFFEVEIEPTDSKSTVKISNENDNTEASTLENESSTDSNTYRNLYVPSSPKEQDFMHENLKTDDTEQKIMETPEKKKSDTSKENIKYEKNKTGAYDCPKCPKKFRQKGYLKRHIRSHTGEKPYACKTCGDSFSDSVFLKHHVRMHSGEAPYICHVCSKPFNQKPHLTEHIRTHTGEKPHVCEKCPCAFAHRSSLKRHIRTHTGEKPYICHICSKKFSQISNLQKHIRTCNVEKKKYVCVKCG